MATTLELLQGLGKSVARGVPQLATGLVDIAALPLTMTGIRQPEQIFGSTAYLTNKGLLPQPQTGLLNQSAELASSMINPSLAAKGATVGLLGTFVGKNSKLWDTVSHSKALKLEEKGVSPEEIWKQTGNVKAPDGKWRQEISDINSNITDNVYEGIKTNKRYQGIMSNALEHPELYKAYPEIGNINTSMYAWNKPEGSYAASNNPYFSKESAEKLKSITVGGPGTTSQKSVALHEIMHDIQNREGFARGGTEESFINFADKKPMYADANILSRINNEYNDIEKSKEIFKQRFNREPTKGSISISLSGLSPDEILAKLESTRRSPSENYRRLAGEAEARLVQRRMNLSPEQRLQYYPYTEGQYGLDVPYNELIVKGLLD